MKIRATQRLLAALLVGLFSVPAVAQFTRDASANSKIDEAINNHYLMMQLDKAEELLTGTVSACEEKCSPQTKAKAWMYVGIVRGSGKNDQAGAAQAFAAAKGFDPAVTLDADLASPETKETFDAAQGDSSAAPVAAIPVEDTAMATSAPGALPPPAGSPGDMLCSPQGEPIGVNMPIPLSCTSDANVAEGFVKFLEPGSSEWKKINLMNIDGMWQADIPCAFTKNAGDLQFYVGVKDSAGEYVDQFGSKKEPATITLAEGGAAPAYPGQAPVSACGNAADADCPPDFPGCGNTTQTCGDLDWGAACKNSSECACGLLCEEGACATAPSCTTNADCDTGSCIDGTCGVTGESDAPSGPFKRNWLSFTAGMDLMTWGAAQDFCNDNNQFDETYGVRCYDASGQRVSQTGVDLDAGGIVPAQLRLKLGYDYAIIDHLRLGLRLGFAFLNTHPKETSASFLPIHVEGRVTYTFTSLSKGGFRPSLYAAGGLAESNGKVSTDTGIDMYRIAGLIFAAPGLNLGYAIAPNMDLSLDTQAMLLFTSGASMAVVIHPALNFTYGL